MASNLKLELKKIMDAQRPKYSNNVDPLIWDYDFYTNLERTVKKERDAALGTLIMGKPVEEGRIVRGQSWALDLKISEVNSFDKEAFIDALIDKYKLPRHELRELAGKSTKSSERKQYTAVDREAE